MFVDEEGDLHISYRGILEDNIRDIMYIRSTDNGESFSESKRISHDNWQIMACPHNGPSITKNHNRLSVIWFTQGEEGGLYYSYKDDESLWFNNRIKLSNNAKHPYISSSNKYTFTVWDEVFNSGNNSYRRVKLSKIDKEGNIITKFLTPTNVYSDTPYLYKIDDENSIVTWTQRKDGKNKLYFKSIL